MNRRLLPLVVQQCQAENIPHFIIGTDVLVTAEYLAKSTGTKPNTVQQWAKDIGVEPKRLGKSSTHWYSLMDWGRAINGEKPE